MKRIFITIGKRIAQKRQELGLSQERLASLSGLHKNYIGYIERGEKQVTIPTLHKIIKVLDISLSDLFEGC